MGKYNFDYTKLQGLENRIRQLEIQNQQLVNDNNKMKAAIAFRSTHNVKDRALLPLVDKTKFDYLFNVDVNPDTGQITSASTERKNTNFTNFYRYLLVFFKPTSKATSGQKNKFYLKWSNLYELSTDEYNRFKKLVLEVVDKLYIAKLDCANSFEAEEDNE